MKNIHTFLHPDTIVYDKERDHPIYWIAEYISRISGLTVQHLRMKDEVTGSRKREYVVARQMAMYFAKEYELGSLKFIANYFGERDHSTAIHGIATIKGIMQTDSKFNNMVLGIKIGLTNIEGKGNPIISGISKELRKNLETFSQIQASL
jgi:hypothetical protein